MSALPQPLTIRHTGSHRVVFLLKTTSCNKASGNFYRHTLFQTINGMTLGASPEPQIPQQDAGNEPVAIQ
jgi:hypothetical protein